MRYGQAVASEEVFSKMMKRSSRVALAVVVAAAAAAARAAPAGSAQVMVVCSPGAPGTTQEAQATMDAFAGALSAKAGTQIAAVYDPSDAGGTKRLQDAALGLVSLPFFLAHEKQLDLHARLVAVAKGRPALDRWVLVAGAGRVTGAKSLEGFTIVSAAAFAPGFVRGDVLGELGSLPASTKVVQSAAVLSALRRAANGDPVVVVLDGPGEDALASLSFASKLQVVARSPAMPAGLVVTVGDRVPAKTGNAIETALLGFGSDKQAAAVLASIRMTGFVAVDGKALDAARKAYAAAAP